MDKYKIRYDFNVEHKEEGFTKDEAGEKGLADAIIICSVLYPEDGSLSHLWSSTNGKENLSSKELFKAFATLANMLSERKDIDDWQRYICKEAFEKVCEVINRTRD